jgi:hypothetical protein
MTVTGQTISRRFVQRRHLVCVRLLPAHGTVLRPLLIAPLSEAQQPR